MIPQLFLPAPTTPPPPPPPPSPKPQRFTRYRRGEHLRRELLPGPVIAMPGTTADLVPATVFSYGNVAFMRIAPPARREIVPATERLLDQVTRFALGEISETEFEAATKRFRDSVFAAAPTPMMQQPINPRREPPSLRQTGNLPWSRPSRPVVTKPAAMSAEGQKLLAFLEHGPIPSSETEPISATLNQLNDEVEAAFWKGVNNVQ